LVTNRNPFHDLLAMHDRLSRLFEGENQDLGMTHPSLSGSWSPPVDMVETRDAVIITVELPGLADNDFHVTVEGTQLVIRGERRFPSDVSQEQIHRMERAYGSFKRTFPLPDQVDVSTISAVQENGVLTVTLPRAKGDGPRRINVVAPR